MQDRNIRLCRECRLPCTGSEADQRRRLLGIDFKARGKVNLDIELHAPGRFSVYNALCAIAICNHFGVTADEVKEALLQAHVKGRIELVKVSDDLR